MLAQSALVWMTKVTPRLAILVPTFSQLQACPKTSPRTAYHKDPDTRKPGPLLTAQFYHAVSQSCPCSHPRRIHFDHNAISATLDVDRPP